MTAASIRNVAVGMGAVSLLTFLFVQQRPVDPQQHYRFMHGLNQLKQLDTEVNRDLLNSRFDLLASYDPFVQKLDEMHAVENDLQHVPPFVHGDQQKQIHQLLKQESQLRSEKVGLVENFKSRNAILKNSLRYFPTLIAEASQTAATANDPQLKAHLSNLLRDILLYDLTPHSDLAGQVNAELALLTKDKARHPELADTLNSATAHAAAIINTKPQVEALTEELNALPTAPSIDAISLAYVRDYENAQKSYQDLLAKKSSADLTVKMNNQSEGERMFPLNPANLPDAPSFPVRWQFALGGLAAGLALGTGLSLWLELRDNSIRTEADAEAALDLPMLVAVPWVGGEVEEASNGKFKFWNRDKNGNGTRSKDKESVRV